MVENFLRNYQKVKNWEGAEIKAGKCVEKQPDGKNFNYFDGVESELLVILGNKNNS
jgi:hypothetical protein